MQATKTARDAHRHGGNGPAAQAAAAVEAGERDYWLPLLGILAALLVARLLALYFGRTDIFFDEAQYWLWSKELAFGYFSKPPLIAWIINLATSVCGDAEWCIRSPSPILYTVSAVFVFLAARALYDARIGFWAAIVFATLPGTSVSSLLISTDVPLLACWTIALYGWIRLVETKAMPYAVLTGASVGVGLLAKYAAIYFVICLAIDALTDTRAREALREWRGTAIAAIALLLVAPNLAWNARHGFATFSHTAANASWGEVPIHVSSALEFLGSQFLVFGPILFAALLWIGVRAWKDGVEQPERRLLAFSLPVLALLTIQALFSRALANWAAVAYPAATMLVTAALFHFRPRLFRISLILHIVAAILLTLGPVVAPQLTRLTGPQWNPYARMLGWREVAAAAKSLAAQEGAKSVLTDTREATAELLYYLRDTGLPVLIWSSGGAPRNHFEMTNPFTPAAAQPLLYVVLNREKSAVPKRFEEATVIAEQDFPSADAPLLSGRFYRLSGYRGDKKRAK